MENFAHFDFIFVLAGALVGLLVGLTGVGGGSLMTPLLTLIFGVSPSIAVGTDLAFASLTKGVGTLAHRIENNVCWPIVRLLSLGSLPASLLTIYALNLLGNVSSDWQYLIKMSIGVSVLLTAVSLIFRPKMHAWLEQNPQFLLQGRKQVFATVLSGILIGVLVTISSIGAGAIGASLILFLYPHLKPAQVAGTDIAYAVPLTAVAALGHLWLGTIHLDLLISLLIGSVPAIWCGAKLTKLISERISRAILAGVLTLVGFKLIL
jgi:hypothetical protein